MKSTQINSNLATPGELTGDRLEKQQKSLLSQPLMEGILNAIPHIVMILNRDRRVILSNRTLKGIPGILDPDDLGARPGELFNCIHNGGKIAGCGMSSNCCTCGVVKIVMESQAKNSKVTGECRITTEVEGNQACFEFMVSSDPLVIGGTRFFIVSMFDISNEKRRRLLERVFFHDILNSAGNILNISRMAIEEHENMDGWLQMLIMSSKQLIDEINSHKGSLDAENGELNLKYEYIGSLECLEFIVNSYNELAAARKVHIHLDKQSDNISLKTDKSVILRVLGNVLKNALEASCEGDLVSAGCRGDNGAIVFWVNNPQYMPEDVQMQIFQRSFSTKGAGRGLGTYSIKLLTEKYLAGQVSFNSTESEGSTFKVKIPLI